MRLIDELRWRELVYDVTDEQFGDFIEENKMTFYLGVDPTGDSLHVGHLVACLVAKRLQQHGHTPILLIGGATGLIGDPKEQGERKMLTIETTLSNAACLAKQVKEIFGFTNIQNNYDWTHKINVIEYLRDFGKFFNVNYMLNKDTVKSRLESGISYTEFSYQILQSLDWLHLYQTEHCNVQIGGQDQWGNITAGIELIRKKTQAETKVYGLTIPLIVKSDGTKFGKTESGSVWLDKNKTTPYDFYQFWINTPDSDVIKNLKKFTFLSVEEIIDIEKKFNENPHERLAQKELAKELTIFIHGKDAFEQAIKVSEALFSGNVSNLTAHEIEMGFKDILTIKVEEVNLVDALISLELASSKREAREFIKTGAVSINGQKCTEELTLTKQLAIEGIYILVRRGKKKYALLQF